MKGQLGMKREEQRREKEGNGVRGTEGQRNLTLASFGNSTALE